MSRQRKSHEERKAEIIQGALELASETGVKEVTAQAIADRIGIAQPTIFRHFKSRGAIFRAAMEWVSRALFTVLEGLNQAGGPARERLQKLLSRQLKFVSKQKGLPRLLFSDRLHLEDPELKATARRIMERYITHLETIIQSGIDSGEFRKDLDPAQTARFIAATIQGLIMRWSIYEFSFNLEEEAPVLWNFFEPILMTDNTR